MDEDAHKALSACGAGVHRAVYHGTLTRVGDFACARVGQQFILWRIIDGLLAIELKCGHPMVVDPSCVELNEEGTARLTALSTALLNDALNVDDLESDMTKMANTTEQKVEKTAKKTATKTATKAAKKMAIGKLPILGFEKEVAALKKKNQTFQWIKAEVDELKQTLRTAAVSKAMEAGSDITSLSFEDGVGGAVVVALPDVAADNNRLQVKSADAVAFADKGLDLESLMETEQSYILTGEFATWLTGLLKQWESQGVELPGGLEERVVTRLTTDGVAELKRLAIGGSDVAGEAIMKFTRAPSVRIPK